MNLAQANLLLGALLLAVSCMPACQPAYPPPPGYEKACYGGNFKKYLSGTRAQTRLIVKARETEWPRLTADLKAAADDLHLDFFDTSHKLDYIRTIEFHLCTERGLWISADQRRWIGEHAKSANQGRDFRTVTLSVHGYKDGADWREATDKLLQILGTRWEVEEKSWES